MADSIQPTPQNAPLGGLAEMLEYLRTQANKKTLIPRDSWLAQQLGGAGEIGNLIFGKSPEEVKEWSYGNAPMRLPPAGTGGYVPDFKRSLPVDEKTGNRVPGNVRSSRSDSLVDTLFAAQPALPLAKAAPRAVEGALNAVARNALQPVPRAQAQLGAVRLKGGNFDPTGVDEYLYGNFRDMPAGATQTWRDKQLRNYITKDLGSTTDPLLAVEKEYPNLHLPDDVMSQDYEVNQLFNTPWAGIKEIAARRSIDPQNVPITRGHESASLFRSKEDAEVARRHYALTDEPLTPWGQQAGRGMIDRNPGEYRELLESTAQKYEIPAWLEKAPPETKIWGINDQDVLGEEDNLGFRHVLDYLEAAQREASRLDRLGGATVAQRQMAERPGVGGVVPWAPPGDDNAADVLRALALHNAGLTLTPEQVARTSVADAVRKTAQWNAFQASQMTDAAPGLAKGIAAVHKEYPEEGMKWVKLGLPGEMPPVARKTEAEIKVPFPTEAYQGAPGEEFKHINPETGEILGRGATPAEAKQDYVSSLIEKQYKLDLRDAKRKHQEDLEAGLNAEGDAMGHCVGGYCEDVASRGTEIYSLRDAKGNPHVTVEVRPSKEKAPWDPNAWAGKLPEYGGPSDEVLAGLGLKRGRVFGNYSDVQDATGAGKIYERVRDSDAYKAYKAQNDALPPEIYQIKGKQNAAPVDKYLPFVQDFVKSGQWGRVGDLRNTGLHHVMEPIPVFSDPKTKLGEVPPGFYTRQEVEDKFRELGYPPEGRNGPGTFSSDIMGILASRGYAAGGSVAPKFSKKAQLLARLNSR